MITTMEQSAPQPTSKVTHQLRSSTRFWASGPPGLDDRVTGLVDVAMVADMTQIPVAKVMWPRRLTVQAWVLGTKRQGLYIPLLFEGHGAASQVTSFSSAGLASSASFTSTCRTTARFRSSHHMTSLS